MALSKTITHKGITVEAAYLRAEAFSGDKDGLVFNLRSYKDEASAFDPNNILSSEPFRFVPSKAENSQRWDKQGYEYLKSLPEFSDAVDV